ncbi:Ubiquitin-domain-containing protein [Mycena kentingensis (nom. inval.)]|nr:Ubiquitin-domain-containing protein [Mycena kentingensis (nom. inval.)]
MPKATSSSTKKPKLNKAARLAEEQEEKERARTEKSCEDESGSISKRPPKGKPKAKRPPKPGGVKKPFRKPVVYLFSPESIAASVEVALGPVWSLSHLYPRPASASAQSVKWQVKTHPDGNLTDLKSGVDVAYLFWEADVHEGRPPTTDAFDPANCACDATNSVLVPTEGIATYLNKVLTSLGLHTEAKTSFITYWLPHFAGHDNIALRFVPQVDYEKAAALTVEPAPDVVTRVCMLFTGVSNEEVARWSGLETRDGDYWKDIVGVDVQRVHDTSLFRVLEWGAMEV